MREKRNIYFAGQMTGVEGYIESAGSGFVAGLNAFRRANEEVPYISFTRNPIDDKATYIGPFYGKSSVEKAVRILRRIFPYYVKPYSGRKTLDTDLGLTPGIEIGKSTPKDYKRNLKKLICAF